MSVTASLAVGIPLAQSCTIATASGDVGVVLNGEPITVTWGSSDAATATALFNAINADPTASALVTATNPSSGVVTLTVNGVPMGALTLAAKGTGSTVSGPFLGKYFNGQRQLLTLTIVNGDATTYTIGTVVNTAGFIGGASNLASLVGQSVPASVTTTYAIPAFVVTGQAPELTVVQKFSLLLTGGASPKVDVTSVSYVVGPVVQPGTPGGNFYQTGGDTN